jgi:hypothetical protein
MTGRIRPGGLDGSFPVRTSQARRSCTRASSPDRLTGNRSRSRGMGEWHASKGSRLDDSRRLKADRVRKKSAKSLRSTASCHRAKRCQLAFAQVRGMGHQREQGCSRSWQSPAYRPARQRPRRSQPHVAIRVRRAVPVSPPDDDALLDQLLDNTAVLGGTWTDAGRSDRARTDPLRPPGTARECLTRKRSLVQTQYRPPTRDSP